MSEQRTRRTPEMFRNATPRGVLAAEESGIGISFDVQETGTIYLFLDIKEARIFCEMLQESLDGSLNSGLPLVDVSGDAKL